MSAPTRRQYQIYIQRQPEVVFGFLSDLKNHVRLCPEGQREEVVAGLSAGLSMGVVVPFKDGPWGDLLTEVSEWDPPHGFTLRQVQGTFATWTHRYRFVPFQEGTLVTEQYEYTLKGIAALSEKVSGGKVWDDWVRHRQGEAKKILERIGRIVGPGR